MSSLFLTKEGQLAKGQIVTHFMRHRFYNNLQDDVCMDNHTRKIVFLLCQGFKVQDTQDVLKQQEAMYRQQKGRVSRECLYMNTPHHVRMHALSQ